MAEEESLLQVCLCVHSDKGAARGEKNGVFIWNSRPLQIEALGGRISNDVSQLHDWVHVELRVHVTAFTDVYASRVRI